MENIRKKARAYADEIWNTSDLSDLSEFNIPLETAIDMMVDFIEKQEELKKEYIEKRDDHYFGDHKYPPKL